MSVKFVVVNIYQLSFQKKYENVIKRIQTGCTVRKETSCFKETTTIYMLPLFYIFDWCMQKFNRTRHIFRSEPGSKIIYL